MSQKTYIALSDDQLQEELISDLNLRKIDQKFFYLDEAAAKFY